MITIPSNAKGLIFDLDGTIANTMPNHFKAWRKAVSPYGIDFNEELFMSLTGMARTATINKLNQLFNTKMNPEIVGEIKNEYFNLLVSETKEIEVVANVIREFHNKLPMAIGTGSTTEGAKQTLEIIDMQQYFNIVITSDDVVQGKPHPETFLKCAELMQVNPTECVVFEDGILGMKAAKTAGMMVIDINEYFKTEFIK
ncbi:MAG: beta-phosphoglucomutase family hydrolase [Lutibacter sp.]|uniref:HAD family hydrolase n=1 Tax=Lutibacter sp. TaxID=1925666 RepID=UPI00299D497F|nr:beta-phosphoglucomutase family hydrolase [Lutibacter sp.]MDX1830110.1 beta-phosphoglucomutase family hydrolase [Lutibacter sp.]